MIALIFDGNYIAFFNEPVTDDELVQWVKKYVDDKETGKQFQEPYSCKVFIDRPNEITISGDEDYATVYAIRIVPVNYKPQT